MSSFGRVVALFGLCLGLVLVGLTSPGVASDGLAWACQDIGCRAASPPPCTPPRFVKWCVSNLPNEECACEPSSVWGPPATCTCYLQ